MEESEPEESDFDSSSSDDDFVAAETTAKPRPTRKKVSTKDVKPASGLGGLSEDMSDDQNSGNGPAKVPLTKARNKEWDSEMEESEPEESDFDSSSSDDDFVAAETTAKPRPTRKKVSTKDVKPASGLLHDLSDSGSDSYVPNAKIRPPKTKTTLSKHNGILRDMSNDIKRRTTIRKEKAAKAKAGGKGKTKVSLGISPTFSLKGLRTSTGNHPSSNMQDLEW